MTVTEEPEGLLKARDVAAILNVEMNTVLDAWQRGDIPGFRLYGRKGGPVRFRRSDIDALLESWRVDRSTPERYPSEESK